MIHKRVIPAFARMRKPHAPHFRIRSLQVVIPTPKNFIIPRQIYRSVYDAVVIFRIAFRLHAKFFIFVSVTKSKAKVVVGVVGVGIDLIEAFIFMRVGKAVSDI